MRFKCAGPLFISRGAAISVPSYANDGTGAPALTGPRLRNFPRGGGEAIAVYLLHKIGRLRPENEKKASVLTCCQFGRAVGGEKQKFMLNVAGSNPVRTKVNFGSKFTMICPHIGVLEHALHFFKV
jgi:hypothetical protein